MEVLVSMKKSIGALTLLGALLLVSSCSNGFVSYSNDHDAIIEHKVFISTSYDFNKNEKIEYLGKNDVAHYLDKFNITKEDIKTYQFWYLITGATQSTGGWRYKTYVEQKNILLCLQSPGINTSVLMALQSPQLLIGVNGDARLFFDQTCD